MYKNYCSFDSLSTDAIHQICCFFDCRTCGQAFATSKIFASVLSEPSIWESLLKLEMVGYNPIKESSRYSSRLKLRLWTTRSFQWNVVGNTLRCRARFLHRSATMNNGDSYIFGGDSSNGLCFNDVWRVTTSEENRSIIFEEKKCVGKGIIATPKSRSASSICAVKENLFMFGGFQKIDNAGFSGEFWKLNTLNFEWQQLSPSSRSLPAGRWGHTLVSYNSYIFLFGGSCPDEIFDDLWMVDVSKITPGHQVEWMQIQNLGEKPCPRGGHSATVVGEYMYVFGGNNLSRPFSDMWRICLRPEVALIEGWEWELIQEADSTGPSSRIGHCAVAIGKYILIYGGRNYQQDTMAEGIYLFDTDYRSWERVRTTGDPIIARTGHCALPCSSGILFFGGLVSKTTELDSETTCNSEVIHLDIFGVFPKPTFTNNNFYNYTTINDTAPNSNDNNNQIDDVSSENNLTEDTNESNNNINNNNILFPRTLVHLFELFRKILPLRLAGEVNNDTDSNAERRAGYLTINEFPVVV